MNQLRAAIARLVKLLGKRERIEGFCLVVVTDRRGVEVGRWKEEMWEVVS